MNPLLIHTSYLALSPEMGDESDSAQIRITVVVAAECAGFESYRTNGLGNIERYGAKNMISLVRHPPRALGGYTSIEEIIDSSSINEYKACQAYHMHT